MPLNARKGAFFLLKTQFIRLDHSFFRYYSINLVLL